ncbi:MAG: efflux RND transporter permease subunit [Bacteroidales bacterium]|jgi:multidrug efflux pump subunit AcrB/outer membrane protein TolC|nr:efflux RND transporter permease subunit [Bacteroidales bacterium]
MSYKKTDIIGAAMRNRNIIIIITAVFIIIGIVALIKMPRNEFPQFTIRQGVVVGVYPGATSAEVEAQLTRVVENYIFSYQEVRKTKTYSQSKEGIMYIFVELNDNVKNADQFWSKLKHGLNELKPTLPIGVLALIANSDFGDTSALLITLSSEARSYKEMEEYLKTLEAECRKIPATSKIKHYGLLKEKIYVNVKPELLNEYNIKSISLLGSYQLNGMVNYAGILKDGKTNLAVHLPANFESEKNLADQIVYSDPRGNVVRLKNIASIERRYEDPDNYIKQNGKKTILLSLEMQPGNNIVEYGKDVDNAIALFEKRCPKDINVAKISELPKYVNDSVSEFMKEFLIAIVAVILVTMILLPFRVASVAGITVPISILITLCILYFFGVELHTVSLAALILVLGMIVDNSIVIIDNHVEKIDHRISPWHAAIKSARELTTPIITATLAIMAAYIPLGFMVPGTAGEFMATLPIVVSIALVVSIIVAIFLVPYLNFVFIKKGLISKNPGKKRKTFLDGLQGWFDASLEKAFCYPKTIISIGIAFVALAILLLRGLDKELFPKMERNQFAVEVYLTPGASIESTAKIVDSLESVLIKDKRVTNVTSFIGTSSPRFHVTYAPNMPASDYGQLLVNTISNEATREIVDDYSPRYSDNFTNAHVKWKILALQLNKAPVEIRISSDSIKDIRNVEAQINLILKKTKHIAWVRTDWDKMQQNIKVNLDRDKANRMGYFKSLVSTSLMIGLDGLPLTTIWENDYPVEVRLSQENTGNKSIKTLEDLYVSSPINFTAVPLRSFADFSPEWTEGTIVRRNGTRTLTIMIDNDSQGIASNIFNEITLQIAKLKLPEGTAITYGGDYEGQVEVFVPMGIALGLSILLIFFILLFEFKKTKLSLLIMSTMLLSLPGAAIGLKLMGYPFSITAFIGITSLCGMVVRNGIILIDYARQLRNRAQMPVHEAAIAAGKRRMRPIFLTSAAASVGVIPMILSRSPLWGPLGTVICFGLMFSMVLTLYILPILYSLVYSDRPKKSGFWSLPATVAATLAILIFPLFSTSAKAQTLSLDSCKTLALLNNHKIKEAAYDVDQSNQQKKSAFTNYFPKVNASAFAFKASDYLVKATIPQMNLPVYDGNPVNLVNPTQFAYVPSIPINLLDYMNVATIMVTQPIFAGGQILNGNRLAKIGYEINREKQNLTNTDVLVKTEELYWTVIALREKTKTLDSYRKLLDTLQRDVSVAHKAGLVQRNDLLKVELKRNEIDVNTLKLRNGIELTQRALCQQIGITYDSTLTLIDPQTEPVLPQQFYTQPATAVPNRSEIKMLSQAVIAEELQKKMTIGGNLPTAAIGVAGLYVDAMKTTTTNAVAFATVSIPITDWWGGAYRIKQGQVRIESARNKLAETYELFALQIEQANNEFNEYYFQVIVAHKSVEQARENLKVTSDNWKAGISSMSDLLEAQSIYQNALDNLTEARCNYQMKKARYLQATGRYNQ